MKDFFTRLFDAFPPNFKYYSIIFCFFRCRQANMKQDTIAAHNKYYNKITYSCFGP